MARYVFGQSGLGVCEKEGFLAWPDRSVSERQSMPRAYWEARRGGGDECHLIHLSNLVAEVKQRCDSDGGIGSSCSVQRQVS